MLLLHTAGRPAGAPAAALRADRRQPGRSLRVRAEIQRVADLEVPVLLRGETGTGKELAARAIHEASRGARRRSSRVNLGAIPPSLAASELFGAARGAFTGSVQRAGRLLPARPRRHPLPRRDRRGAPRGAGDAPARAGDRRDPAGRRPDAAAGRRARPRGHRRRPRGSGSQAGTFRAPLLHRLAGYEIWLPPLRERRDDIGRLLVHFLRQELAAHRRAGAPRPGEPAARSALAAAGPGGPARPLRLAGQRPPAPQRRPASSSSAAAACRSSADRPAGRAPARAEHAVAGRPAAGRVADRPGGRRPRSGRGRRKPAEIAEDELLAALRAHRWDLKARGRGAARSRGPRSTR